MGILNATNEADKHESIEKAEEPVEDTGTSLLIKQFFEKHHSSKVVLLLVVLLGTSMVIGDGILSSTMSGMSFISINLALSTHPFVLAVLVSFLDFVFTVPSAVSGLQVKVADLHDSKLNPSFFSCFCHLDS